MGLTGGDRRGEGKGDTVSAGHSLRRQNYSFVTVTPPTPHTSIATHLMRVVVALVTAAALSIATFASISLLIAGR